MEYANIGSLYDVLTKSGPMNERIARFFLRRLASAVDYLHSHDMAHRDIKPLNILVKSDINMVKLGDFGHCSMI
jgi:serine/threonine protein kinase